MPTTTHCPAALRRWVAFTILLVSAGGAFPTAVIATEVVDAAPADGYRGIWYSVGRTGDEYRYKYSGGLGTYCAKHAPFAVHRAEVGKTFFVYGGAASGTTDRLVHMVGCYDHQTGLFARPRLLLDKQTGDAHDNPVLSVDYDGHLWVFSTSHGRGRPSFIHKSVEPYAIDRFERIDAVFGGAGGETPLDNFSYVQAWRRPTGGFAAFFTHYQDPADRTSMFMTSEDGRRWSAWTRLAAIEKGHYQISAAREGLLAAAFNYHPRSGGLDSRTNLYYLQTPDSGHSWQTADGQPVDTPVTSPDSPCLVHDFASEGRNVYLKDIRLDGAGRPLILVVTSGGHAPGPTNDPRTWELFRWTGDAWRRSVVARSDNNYDMGSLYLEDGRLRVIAPTLPGPQAYNPGGEIAIHVSTDGGQTWRLERRLTGGSEHNHGYVRRPVDAAADFYALWADGHGRQPSESRLYFCTQAGEVFRLPTTMDSEWARPQPVAAPPADARPQRLGRPCAARVAPPPVGPVCSHQRRPAVTNLFPRKGRAMSMYAMIELDESGHQPLPPEFDPDNQGFVYGQNLGQCRGVDELNAICEAAGVEPIENFLAEDLDEEEMEEFGLDPDEIDEKWSPLEDGVATLKALIAELEKRPADSLIGEHPAEAILWDLRVSLSILENAPPDQLFRYVVGQPWQDSLVRVEYLLTTQRSRPWPPRSNVQDRRGESDERSFP